MMETLNFSCVVCHQSFPINTNNKALYQSEVVRKNAVCPRCLCSVNRIKITLKCAKCSHEFQTKVLMSNKDNYTDKWLCPLCASNGAPKSEVGKNRIELNCGGCRVERGVCTYPDLGCTLSREFITFGNGDLYSLNRECTILSIHEIDKSRDDIHCLNYTLLYKAKCSLSPSNSVIIKQRVGSRKSFVTNILVYRFDKSKSKFGVVLNKKFERGKDWIVPVRDFLLTAKECK